MFYSVDTKANKSDFYQCNYGGFLFTIHHQTIFCHGKIETEKERPLFFNTIFIRDPKAKGIVHWRII